MDVRTERYTVEEYELLGASGVFSEDDRIELIEGAIVEMTPKGIAHSEAVTNLNEWFAERRGNLYRVRIQDPIVLSNTSEPEPDIVLARPLAERRVRGHPRPEDVFLVVEVADSSLAFDRGRKADLYARAGIAEYWVANVLDFSIDVFRDPSPTGYKEVRTYRPGESISVLAFPDLLLPVSEIVS